jgi:hypothetical protein
MRSLPARRRIAARSALAIFVLATVLAGCAGCAATPSATPKRSTTTVDPPAPSTSSTSTTVSPQDAKKPPVPSNGAYFGTWRGPGPGRPAEVQNRLVQAEQQIGRKYAIDHRYYDWGFPLPSPYEEWTSKQGRIPLVNLCACHFNDGSVVPWSEIASGAHDAYLSAMADRFAAFAKPVFFIFDGEPESKVDNSTGQTPAAYIAAWRHIVETFRAHHADNVAFMWDTTAYSFTAESGDASKVKSIYPGDDVVDWIASDPYNFNHSGAWRSLSFELDAWYRWARAEHPNKPLALAEWGSKEDAHDPQHKAEWLREALKDLQTKYRQIKAVVYFDEKKYEDNTVNDWRIDTSTPSSRAFAEIARSRWFDFSVRRGG